MNGRALITAVPHGGGSLVTGLLTRLGLRELGRDRLSAWGRTRPAAAGPWASAAEVPAEGAAGTGRDGVEAFQALAAALVDGSYWYGHLPFDASLHRAARQARVPVVFVYRDPRLAFRDQGGARGEAGAFAATLAGFTGWLTAPGVLAVRAEELLARDDVGALARRAEILTTFASHIGWGGLASALLEAIAAFDASDVGGPRPSGDGDAAAVARPEEAALDEVARAWGYGEVPETWTPSRSLSGLDTLLAGIRTEQAALLRERRQLIGELTDRDDDLRRLRRELATVRAERERFEHEAAERLGVVHRLETQLAEMARLGAHFQRDSEDRLGVIRRLEARMAESNAVIAQLRSELAEAKATNVESLQDVANLRKEVRRLTSQLAERAALR